MGMNSQIAWCDHTANLWWGCTQVKHHRGCDYCYAKDWDRRFAGGSHWGNKNVRRETVTVWKELTSIQNKAKAANRLDKVFVGSMMDIFEPSKVTDRGHNTGEVRHRLFENIDTGLYDHIIFQFLTKRPDNIRSMIPEGWYEKCPPNLWFGTSISQQSDCEGSIGNLYCDTPPGALRFLSVEPLIEEVTLEDYLHFEYYVPPSQLLHGDDSGARYKSVIDWVIVGGESGKNARPMQEDWAINLLAECQTYNVPFFFKQAGVVLAQEWNCSDAKGDRIEDFPSPLQVRQFPDMAISREEHLY